MNAVNTHSLAVTLLSFAVPLLLDQAAQADTPTAASRPGCSHLRYSAIPLVPRPGDILSAADLNEKGEVVGSVSDGSTTEAMFWKNGRYVRLGERIFSGALFSGATAINNRSQIVGQFLPPDFNTEEYVLDRHGVSYILGAFSSPREINERGDVVGLAIADGLLHGAVWHDGETIVLPFAPGHEVDNTFDINNRGTVVGFGAAPNSNSEAVVWFAPYTDVPTVIPLPANAVSSPNVRGVNNRNQVILDVALDTDVVRSYVWTANRPLRVLEPLPGFLHSSAEDINTAGLVVGISTGGSDNFNAATVWRGGETCALSDLVATPGLEGHWTDASRVNESGDILAFLESETGATSFLLRPRR